MTITTKNGKEIDLKNHLYEACNILRGPINQDEYKSYLTPLLFFKRISDVYDAEFSKALEESDGDIEYAKFDENHRFSIPERAHWKNIREKTSDIGKALEKAFRDIEKANKEKLTGIFGNAPWTNKNRLPDSLLKELIEHFSSKTLSIANCPEDELGIGYEYLIKKFADDSGHTAQEFYTNRTVVHLMTELLEPQSGESVYDPTCGSAGMLISSIAYLKDGGKEWRNVKLYGQELNGLTSAIGRMNLFLHGVKDIEGNEIYFCLNCLYEHGLQIPMLFGIVERGKQELYSGKVVIPNTYGILCKKCGTKLAVSK